MERWDELHRASRLIRPYGIEFASMPTGEFQMRSINCGSDEKPVHRVVIGKSFQLWKYEITKGQWKAVMGNNPSFFASDDTMPVESLTWNSAQQYIDKLNLLNDGYQYRLPSEAEWEYSCRAGTTGDYAGNLDEMAWYDANSGGTTHPVGTKKPNAWELYDMHGNAAEWVQDWYGSNYYSSSPLTDPQGPSSGTERTGRSGIAIIPAYYSRSAMRGHAKPDDQNSSFGTGLRVLRTSK